MWHAHPLAASPFRRPHFERLEPRLVLSSVVETADPLAGLNAGEAVDAALSSAPHIENRAVATNPGVQVNPSLAINPLDPDHVVIAHMDRSLVDTGYAGIGVAVSRDGGESWEHSSIPLPEPFTESGRLPQVAFDELGRVFVAFGAATFLGPKPGPGYPSAPPDIVIRMQSHNGIFVARSDDGGMTWNKPATVVSSIYDGEDVSAHVDPSLAVDTYQLLPNGQPNPHYGNLYVVWTDLYAPGLYPGFPGSTGGRENYISVSRDGGETWETQLRKGVRPGGEVDITVLDGGRAAGAPQGFGVHLQPRVTVDREGGVYVMAFSVLSRVVEYSTTGGVSFLQADHASGERIAFFPIRDFALNGLANARFEMQLSSAIAADPTRPGRVYAVEIYPARDAGGQEVDGGDVHFARSSDYGATWNTDFVVGTVESNILNDDNDGQLATGMSQNEVNAGQWSSYVVVDDRGTIVVIWGDQRRDPANRRIDLFGTISTDGGLTFSPNFRITDVTFDAEQGSYIDARGMESFYFGRWIARLDAADGNAYITWTDTRTGNRDIYFARFALDPIPAALNDRFEPNDVPSRSEELTDLGRVAKRSLPKLRIVPGDEDWYSLASGATGTLTVSALAPDSAGALQIELWDREATTRLAVGTDLFDEDGRMIGQLVGAPSKSGERFSVRVLPADGSDSVRYSLNLQALTEDLGTQVHGARSRTMEDGEEFLYLLATAAAGSLDVQLAPGANVEGKLHVELLDVDDLSLLRSGESLDGVNERISLPVERGQAVLIHVAGDAGAQGAFTLAFTNLDQFNTPENRELRFPAGSGPSELVVADLDGDGNSDLVVSNTVTDTVSVLLANGDGTFQAPRQFSVGAFVPTGQLSDQLPSIDRVLAVADFNRDRIPDIAVTNSGSADVSVLIGRGDGTFEPQRRFNATEEPSSLDAGDLNGDGVVDLVVTSPTPLSTIEVAILLARGDGTFEPQRILSVPVSGETTNVAKRPVAIGDFDGDGHADLAVRELGQGRGRILTFFGNGDGTFVPGPTSDAGGGPVEGTVADVNNDGNLDLVYASTGLPLVWVHLGTGDGSFTELPNSAAMQSGFTAGTSTAVAVADLVSEVSLPDSSTTLGPPDGIPDILVTEHGLFGFEGEAEVAIIPGRFDEDGNLNSLARSWRH